MTRTPNAFEAVRPRAASAAPAAAPARPVQRGAHQLFHLHTLAQPGGVRALDRLGRPVVPLAPRAYAGGVIEGAAQGRVNSDRRRAMLQAKI
jgi:hypothetical protein